MAQTFFTSALSVLFGILAVMCALGVIRSIQLGSSDLREGRRDGRGLMALLTGTLPNGRERAQLDLANGVNSNARDGGIVYHKKARAFR